MKKNIFFGTLATMVAAVALTGCDDNAWNDKLDGFEDENDKPAETVETIEYTLTAADYASIASNSANVALAGDNKNDLAAIKTRQAFNDVCPAKQYVPAFLASTSFPYFTLDNGSAIKLTYNVVEGLPAELNEAASAYLYTVTEDNYKDLVWESDENYVNAFSPLHPASDVIPSILKDMNYDLGNSAYCVVSYNEATQEPVFGGNQGGEEEWAMTDVIGKAALEDDITVNGVVTGICAQGFILTDNSGSILVYMGSSFDAASRAIGEQLTVAGTVGAYNKGLQITGSSATITPVGTQTYTYPAAKAMTGADLDAAVARTDNELAQYVKISGKAVVTERNINIIVDGAEKAQGSVYQGTAAQKAAFADGEQVTVEGYFIAIAAGRYFNMVVTKVNGKALAPRLHSVAKAAAAVPTKAVNMLYVYQSGRWRVASGFITLNPDDYTEMGRTVQDLGSADAARLLPQFLKVKKPYAQADDTVNVMYRTYNSSDKTTVYTCDQYVYNGSEWVVNNGIVTETSQFVRTNGAWVYDPSVTINLPAGRNTEPSATYFQACVDWVYENICVPMGDTSIKSGKFYVSSYGNNEYYSGTSAYQGNVDLRPSAARSQYAAGYTDMSDDEIVALEKKRFMNEVMPGALSKLHADAKPVDGVEVVYTINFYAYNGSVTTPYTARFRVTAPGTFEPIDCTWDAN